VPSLWSQWNAARVTKFTPAQQLAYEKIKPTKRSRDSMQMRWFTTFFLSFVAAAVWGVSTNSTFRDSSAGDLVLTVLVAAMLVALIGYLVKLVLNGMWIARQVRRIMRVGDSEQH
jgi:hypothetical protein